MYRPPDPIAFGKWGWPHVTFYRQQKELIYSVLENDETYAPWGNMMGKDFATGFLAVYCFLTRNPCRIVTTSAKDDHLRVLWGEINWFIQECKYPLDARQGGPLLINHQDIHKIVDGRRCPISYMKGMVAGNDSIAAMQGHHVKKTGDGIPRAFFFSDESSSVADAYYKMASTWFHRGLFIGNTWPCDNYFKRGIQGGDVPSKDGKRFYRKVIKVPVTESPNIRYAVAELKAGRKHPSGTVIVPGVKDYDTYIKERQLWDDIQLTVSHGAEFYEGKEVKLYPGQWLARAKMFAAKLRGRPRKAKAIGVDSAEGGDKSSWSIVDELGILEQVSLKTPKTTDVPDITLSLMRKWNVPPERVLFDTGGGGKEHADYLRERKGLEVGTIAFGESVTPPIHLGMELVQERIEHREDRYAYVNRRAQMYGELSLVLDPDLGGFGGIGEHGFGIPGRFNELLRQMGPIPKLYDPEGRGRMLPKDNKNKDSKEPTLKKLLGCSPDELDSLVLGVHAMLHRRTRFVAGALSLT